MPENLATSLPIPKKILAHVQQDTYTRMVMIIKIWKDLEYPSPGELKNKLCQIVSMKYYTSVNRTELQYMQQHAMVVGDIIVGEKSKALPF